MVKTVKISVFFSILMATFSLFAKGGGNHGGGGDPRAAAMAANMPYVCEWIAETVVLRDKHQKCLKEAADLLASLNTRGRKPRIYSLPDSSVVDEFGTFKDGYTDLKKREIAIAMDSWNKNPYGENLVTSMFEMLLLLDIPHRYTWRVPFTQSQAYQKALENNRQMSLPTCKVLTITSKYLIYIKDKVVLRIEGMFTSQEDNFKKMNKAVKELQDSGRCQGFYLSDRRNYPDFLKKY